MILQDSHFVSVNQAKTFYVVLDIPFKELGPRLKKINDVRLLEVSPTFHPNHPHNDRLGLLVGAPDEDQARLTVSDIFRSYKIERQ